MNILNMNILFIKEEREIRSDSVSQHSTYSTAPSQSYEDWFYFFFVLINHPYMTLNESTILYFFQGSILLSSIQIELLHRTWLIFIILIISGLIAIPVF